MLDAYITAQQRNRSIGGVAAALVLLIATGGVVFIVSATKKVVA